MVSQRQKILLLNTEAQLRNERVADVFLCVEARAAARRRFACAGLSRMPTCLQALHAHGLAALTRELRTDGELVLRFDTAPRRGAAPQFVRKNAAVLACALPLHLLACACAREPKADGGWAQELMPGKCTSGVHAAALRKRGLPCVHLTRPHAFTCCATHSRSYGAPAARHGAAAAPAGAGGV
jgi:hypothetical protein